MKFLGFYVCNPAARRAPLGKLLADEYGRASQALTTEDYRKSRHGRAEHNHGKSDPPGRFAGIPSQSAPSHEEQHDSDGVRNAKRSPGIAHEHEREDHREERPHRKQEYPQSPLQIVICKSCLFMRFRKLSQPQKQTFELLRMEKGRDGRRQRVANQLVAVGRHYLSYGVGGRAEDCARAH
jgi:hypothetical protein